MVGAPSNSGSELRVSGDDRTTVAQRAEVLARIEAEGRRRADATGPPSAQSGTVRLRGILDHGQSVP